MVEIMRNPSVSVSECGNEIENSGEERESTSSTIYSGNILIRSQYYGSMETVKLEDGSSTPHLRKASRFRVEPMEDGKSTQLIARSPSLAQLENPEFQTRWYFKYFLGQVHSNYVFADSNNNAYALSVCLTDVENHGIPQFRAILWRKSGCRRICFPYDPHKSYTAKEVLRFFMKDKLEKNPREIASANVQKVKLKKNSFDQHGSPVKTGFCLVRSNDMQELLVLEEQEGSVNFKFGVIYAKQGQATDDEMFGNESGSKEFDNFLNVLGDTVSLQGWTRFRGGLNVKDNMTGTHSLYTVFEGHEVMFHVSCMLPYSKDSPQQVERKRHIGNDIAVIVFVDGEPTEELCFKPSSIRTKFTHVFAVVRYSKLTKSYWLSVFSEENVPVFGPPLPIPPKFVNPHEFRSFLIMKLMNGEKAAYTSPAFSNKRQRTLESLINGLQDNKWAKPEKFMRLSSACEQIAPDHGHQCNAEKRKLFLEVGQSLKVNKILQGSAPTSVANVGGLLAVKNIPWTPHPVLSSFSRRIICGDLYRDSLLISADNGIFIVSEHSSRQVFDHSMTALQLNVVESYSVFVVRVKKNGRIYVIPLWELDDRPFIFNRRHCNKYYMKGSKGCHVYTLSRRDSPSKCLAFAVGKRISLLTWNESSVWYASQNSPNPNEAPAGFENEWNFVASESPRTITITTDVNKNLILCLGLRLRFDIVNVQTKEVYVVKNIVMYRKPKIISALDVFDDNNPELLLTYSHSSAFVHLHLKSPDIVSFYWNNAPRNIVCAFPYILGFSENSIEIRLMVNGNLVHTLCVPHLNFITAKTDIYFSSSTGTLHTKRKKKNFRDTPISQTFMKIRLSDLAGLNFQEEAFHEANDDVFFRRNVGVYASYNTHSTNTTETPTRTYSVSVTSNAKENIHASTEKSQSDSNVKLSKSCDSFQSRSKSLSLPSSSAKCDKQFVTSSKSLLKNTKNRGDKVDGTSIFYSPRRISHTEEIQKTANKIFESKYIPIHRMSMPEKSNKSKSVVKTTNKYEVAVTKSSYVPKVTTIV